MTWLDTLTDWGFGIAAIRFLIALFFTFVIGYVIGTSKGYYHGIRDGTGMISGRKELKSSKKELKLVQKEQK